MWIGNGVLIKLLWGGTEGNSVFAEVYLFVLVDMFFFSFLVLAFRMQYCTGIVENLTKTLELPLLVQVRSVVSVES